MATRLPPPGPLPAGQHPGCDTSGMLLVHRIFRWLYRELPVLVRDVAPGDTARAAVVGRYAHLDVFALHLHHETEDLALWDRLVARDPACALHVGRMRAQHAEVARHLARVEPQIDPWVATADPALRDALATVVERVRDALAGHLREEEDDVLPVAGALLSQEEWDWMERHTRAELQAHRKELGKDLLALQLGLLLASVPADEREEWFRTNVPAPVRVLYLLLMKRRYDHAMREIYPGRPVPAMA